MRTIQISDEDSKFLEDLQHELNTQTNDDEDMEAWNEVDKTNIDDVVRFCHDKLDNPQVRIIDVAKKSEISRQTGAFITKRACQQYIDCYGYNHNQPHTYAMTAYRNFELERLLKILKTMEFKDNQPASEPAKEPKKLEMPHIDEIRQFSFQNIGACTRGNVLPIADFAEKTIEWYIKWYNKKNKEE